MASNIERARELAEALIGICDEMGERLAGDMIIATLDRLETRAVVTLREERVPYPPKEADSAES